MGYVKPRPSYCICLISTSIIILLLLLWLLFKDQTVTTTGGCASCLMKCDYVVSNNCVESIQRGPVFSQPSGPCSQATILKSCAQTCQQFGPQCTPPAGPPGTCVIWGDPHILTFDNKRVDFYSPGQYWLVKSDTVWIQGLYQPTHATSGLSVMKAIGFGGPFMKDNKLVIGCTAASATWNGQPILTMFPSNFQNELVTAAYDSNGATMQDGRQGKQLHVIHLTLPLSVNVQINRWMEASEGNYINAKITMPAQPNQDGHCGNFNGNQADDDRLQIRQRLGKTGVEAAALLFPGGKIPVTPANRPDINNCARPKLEDAKSRCKAKAHKFIPSMSCLIDVCFGGAGFAGSAGAEGM